MLIKVSGNVLQNKCLKKISELLQTVIAEQGQIGQLPQAQIIWCCINNGHKIPWIRKNHHWILSLPFDPTNLENLLQE